MECKRKQLLRLLLLSSCFSATVTQAESIRFSIVDAETGEPIENAVIELMDEGLSAPTAMDALVDQVDKEFVPSVTVVPRGSRVHFPNSDNILHHVYSFSPAKTFDIPLYGSDAEETYVETFNSAGVVEIGCNIHDWMLAYIYVAQSNRVVKTDANGLAGLEDLTPGLHRLRLWHPRQLASEDNLQTVEIQAGQDASASFSIELGRDRRIRRAPSSTRNRYR